MSVQIMPRMRQAGSRLARVVTRPAPTVSRGAGPTESTPPPPRLPGRRNPRWIALGVAAICLGGLLSYVLYSRVASETAVLAATRTI
jgi:hypothetical protein